MPSLDDKETPSPKRIFLTGATGYIGSVITELAIANGYSVHGLSRTAAGDAKLLALGATPIRGDISTLDILRKESSDADIVMHLAFNHDFTADYEDVLRVDAAAVDALAEPLRDTVKPLVISSGAAGVQPDPEGGETDENGPPLVNPLIDRLRAEQHSLSWNQKGVRVHAIRLAPYTYGRGGKGFLALLMQMAAKAGESIYIDAGTNRTSTVHVDDAARLYLLVAEKTGPGEIFNCVSSTDVSMKEMASAIGDALALPVKSVAREEVIKRWGAFLATFVGLQVRVSSRKAIEMLGWEPKEIDILSDVREGSYREFAAQLKWKEAGEDILKV